MSRANDIVANWCRARIESLESELKAAYDNLTATQERCNVLLTENRKLRSHNASMRLRWLQLLDMQGWEKGQVEEVFDAFDDPPKVS